VEREQERDLLTIAEAAAVLGLTVRGVQERVRRRHMHGVRVSPRLWLIPRSEVERAKEAGRLKPGPKPGVRGDTSTGKGVDA
jgi:excisionase family DNA binding protein